MKLIELFERIYYAPDTDQIVSAIKRDCQPWLAESGGLVVYRGMSNVDNLDFFKETPSKNRTPTDTESSVHFRAISLMKEMGYVAHRGNGLFVSGSEATANRYGTAYVVFPIGDFKYTWSPEIHDFFAESLFRKMGSMSDQKLKDIISTYQTTDLQRAIRSKFEIIISCESYYAVSVDMYDDIDLSSAINESTITEGLYDKNTFKAIIMAGTPGSGKSYVSQKIANGFGLKFLDSDKFLNAFSKLKQHDIHDAAANANLHTKASELSYKQSQLFLERRLGMVIDGTGRDYAKIAKTKRELDELGYDTKMVLVTTDLDTALQRNSSRERVVDPNFIKQAHRQVQQNIEHFEEIFGHNLIILDNSPNSGIDFDMEWKKLDRWLNKPVNNPRAHDWRHSEFSKKHSEHEEGRLRGTPNG
jgi:adenylate kinase family enzyme